MPDNSENIETKEIKEKYLFKRGCHHGGASDAIYGLGVIGVGIYYLQHATSFIAVLSGIIKAIGWPAVLLYRVFELLRM